MDVNGLGMSKVRTHGLRSSIGNKVCELSNVSWGFAGKSGSFWLPQHHDGVNIKLLDFWGRHAVPAASALSRKDATGGKWRFLGASTLLTLECCIRNTGWEGT